MVDVPMALGGLHDFSVNHSTLDREHYAKDRGKDHLGRVLCNLGFAKDTAMAEEMVSRHVKGLHRNNFPFSHPSCTASSAQPQSRNRQCRQGYSQRR